MTGVRFAEVDGRRVELADGQLFWETRCDACGEFVATDDLVQVDYRVMLARVPGTQRLIDLHQNCALTRLDWPGVIVATIRQLAETPLPGVPQ